MSDQEDQDREAITRYDFGESDAFGRGKYVAVADYDALAQENDRLKAALQLAKREADNARDIAEDLIADKLS